MPLRSPPPPPPDADAANKMAKDNGCTKCHSVDKTKKGPAFQKTAAKYKGKADAEAKLTNSSPAARRSRWTTAPRKSTRPSRPATQA